MIFRKNKTAIVSGAAFILQQNESKCEASSARSRGNAHAAQERLGAGKTKAYLDGSLKSRISSLDAIHHLGSLEVLVLLQHSVY